MEIVFGPVPSRRLGRSLGINNIPPKVCTYSCVYCQLGRTHTLSVERRPFYEPEEIVGQVKTKVAALREADDSVDYLTFVPDGEPTLDANLGVEIAGLRDLGIPIALISNASLIWREDVRADLTLADWVSLKVDAVEPDRWHSVNRPHGTLDLASILSGVESFARAFRGQLLTETMLVRGLNDDDSSLCGIAATLGRVGPSVAYISIPTRPPAEESATAPTEKVLSKAHRIFSEHIERVELLIGYEGSAFAATGDPVSDILSITAVHPMRRDAVEELLAKTGSSWGVVEELIRANRLAEISHEGSYFYLRRIPRPSAEG